MERRTLSEIYDALALEKANMDELKGYYTHYWNDRSVLDDTQTLMEDLSSKSKVAIWRLLLWVVAVAIWVHEGLWFVFKGEVDAALDSQIAHTTRWYQQESLNFQYGDTLLWDEDERRYKYLNVDDNKKIIARAAVQESLGSVAIKVAAMSNGKLAALSAEQKAAFSAYWAKYKDAGVILNIISEPADSLELDYEIYYDPMVLNASGALISDTSIHPVEEAILDYLDNLDFNGILRLEQLDAAVGKATGVIDFKRTGAHWKYGTYNYTDINISQVAYSGYFEIDPSLPLHDTIDYIAHE